MAYVVGENCIKCKYTDCVEVCPVDCFYEGDEFLVIDPDECIDCALCEPECPVEAIFHEDELPEDQQVFSRINAELAKSFTNITEADEKATKTARLAEGRTADDDPWNGVPGKRQYLPEEVQPLLKSEK